MFHNNRHENWESETDGVSIISELSSSQNNVPKCEFKFMFKTIFMEHELQVQHTPIDPKTGCYKIYKDNLQ